ncbi:MAG: adenosylmethionine--8-amino-7-oxononanoate transaminase [Verrucomicrobiaceae bacterium]|nr:MAG: adenosylmethionine--8-amino-7-oxononanoate transaminase [Verrucomicrobiaceae bacterium]
MTPDETAQLTLWDKTHVWHPFTQMRDWCAPEHQPLFITRGEGVWLYDQEGRRYIDGNSTIWTNIHGHGHPALNAALLEQAGRIAHVSALGFANEPAARLARALTDLWPAGTLTRVFFSDDGSTAIECAVKMALQYHQLTGHPERCAFAAFDQAYHGDTMAAATLGGIAAFADRFRKFGLTTHHFQNLEALRVMPEEWSATLAAVIIEPLMQGSAGMRPWPAGMLAGLRAWCDKRSVLLICDEVMTGFGRTGKMFACENESVIPDFLCLAKGITGGYMPLAATLTTERIFGAFLGAYAELRTFFYGHSYTGNPLACAVALASLEVFRREDTLVRLQPKMERMSRLLAELRARHPRHVGEVRQCGFMAGIQLMADAETGEPYPWEAQTGARVCLAARAHGLLTRPIRDTVVLMPPLVIPEDALRQAVQALSQAIGEVCGPG